MKSVSNGIAVGGTVQINLNPMPTCPLCGDVRHVNMDTESYKCKPCCTSFIPKVEYTLASELALEKLSKDDGIGTWATMFVSSCGHRFQVLAIQSATNRQQNQHVDFVGTSPDGTEFDLSLWKVGQ